LIAVEGAALLPYDKLTFALRSPGSERVIMVEPGERRSFPNLPEVVVDGTALARVLTGEAPSAFAQRKEATVLMIPLRVAGVVQGALVFSAEAPAILTENHATVAQRLADIVAAHLELIRRPTALQPPSTSMSKPGVKLGGNGARALPATPPKRELST
jgi:hypothetical protein